ALIQLVGQGPHMGIVVARGDDKIIRQAGNAVHFDYVQLFRLLAIQESGRFSCQFQRRHSSCSFFSFKVKMASLYAAMDSAATGRRCSINSFTVKRIPSTMASSKLRSATW